MTKTTKKTTKTSKNKDKQTKNDKISINSYDFCRFLTLSTMKSQIENKEAILDIQKNTISSRISSPNSLVAIRGELKGKFPNWGQIGIDNMLLLKNFCTSLETENVEIHKTENKLVLTTPKTKFSSLLRSPKYIPNYLDNDRFNKLITVCSDQYFNLTQDTVKEIISYYNTLNPPEILISAEDKTLTLNLENQQNELKVNIEIPQKIKPFSVKVADFFITILSVIDNDITIAVKDKQSPVYIKTENDNHKFEYIVCPINK